MKTSDLLLSELLFVVIMAISLIVFFEFRKSKENSVLKKLMMWWFGIEVFIYFSSAIFFILAGKGYIPLSSAVFRIIVLTPKAVMCCRLLYFLKTGK